MQTLLYTPTPETRFSMSSGRVGGVTQSAVAETMFVKILWIEWSDWSDSLLVDGEEKELGDARREQDG